ncbi:MAG: helix-turn-helix transcriptional regulator [Clostridia bacterium]|nr:helix-turn-helix transcriptional regulator [Clostridia bacterium]
MKVFAKRLKELRKENLLSQNQVAKTLGITQQSYARYEADTSEPSLEMLVEISNLFEVSCDYLLGKTEY